MRKIIDPETKKELKVYTFEQVFSKMLKSKKRRKIYEEELARRRLAYQIKLTRQAKKLSQTQVARKANMPQSVIARLESGKHSVSLDTLSRVAYALGKKVELI